MRLVSPCEEGFVIIDRRGSKDKSSVNRARFMRRFKTQIQKAVSDAVNRDNIKDIPKDQKIGISRKALSEPIFRTGRGGVHDIVVPGNDKYASGETIERPSGEEGRGSKASKDGEGLDEFIFTLSREEFLNIFFDELALPDMVKKSLESLDEFKRTRAGYSNTGVPTNINMIRTMRGALGRKIACGGPFQGELRALKARLEEMTLQGFDKDSPEVLEILEQINKARAKITSMPFIDPLDLRYNNYLNIPKPSAKAVMFCIMDVSGSMDEDKKNIAKRFFTLLYLFLIKTYEHIDIVFIRHHAIADEVDEETFFHSQMTGGTIVSTALQLTQEIIESRYSGNWNIYGAQASDGDNWGGDTELCMPILERIVSESQYFAYIEIADSPQILWEAYEDFQETKRNFAMRRITKVADIYPVFCDLFKRHT